MPWSRRSRSPSLLDGVETRLAGWHGPPWLKEGWFHAWLLQAPAMPAASAARGRGHVPAPHRGAAPRTAAERINLERRLVAHARAGCERWCRLHGPARGAQRGVLGGHREHRLDSQAGLGSPMFLRTVKLKDFPWNGWLAMGVDGRRARRVEPGRRLHAIRPDAWCGRRSAIRRCCLDPDNGALHSQSRASCRPSRTAARSRPTRSVPAGGVLKPAGAGVTARTKLVYRVLLSNFHDDQKMSGADLLYPYALATRWGVSGGRDYDPEVDGRRRRCARRWPQSGSCAWTRRSATSATCRSSTRSRWPRSI